MAVAEHLEMLAKGVVAWNRWREENASIQPDLTAADLTGICLPGANLRGTNLHGARLLEAKLAEVNLAGADLAEANLNQALLASADLAEANLQGSSLVDANLNRGHLLKANLTKANLRGASLVEANLHSARVVGADLAGANLYGARLVEADLTQANLDGVRLVDANLSAAILSGASLVEARLHGVRLRGADLSGANLQRAYLMETDLDGVRLAGADVVGTVLIHASLGSVDLRPVARLEAVDHGGPSTVSTSTLALSEGQISSGFLRGCGLQDWEIAAAKLYNPNLTDAEVIDAQYEVIRLRTDPALRFDSCFISYSHAGKAFAVRLEDRLQKRSIRCWRDEKDMKPGERILDAVDKAVRVHDRVLLCCSEASLNSWWVKDEIRKALERERAERRLIIIPLNLDGYLLDGWEDGLASELRSRLAADFTGWENDDAKFDDQFERVIQALRQEPEAGALTES